MVGSLSQISLSEITFVPIPFYEIKVELKLPFALVLWHDSGKILGEKIYSRIEASNTHLLDLEVDTQSTRWTITLNTMLISAISHLMAT